MSQSVLLPLGPFTRLQTEAVTAAYRNITIEDDQGSHFRLVVCDSEGRIIWMQCTHFFAKPYTLETKYKAR
ncbi:hypothetical protein CD187_03315 [Citrobacter youngae]|nr:hypothetical protein CD187_03315 [Citrobacter youngae]